MKYIIIGGVAGGATTAARLRRLDEHDTILLLERGPHISYANCGLPYYIGGVIRERNNLLIQTPTSFGTRFNIDVRVLSEVTAIDPKARTVTVRMLQTGETYMETYDKLVLSPGAAPIRPKLTGIDLEGIFTLRNVEDTDAIKRYIKQKQAKHAVVVGAGFIGLEMVENLYKAGLRVTLVERTEQVMPPLDLDMAALVHQHLKTKQVECYLHSTVDSFSRSGDKLLVNLNASKTISTDLVILSVGVRPDIQLAKAAGLAIGETGGIVVNAFLQTSDPAIYVLGDAIEFTHPVTGLPTTSYLAGPANKQGRIVADNLVRGNVKAYKGSVNTAIAKVFDLTVASTGLSAKALQQLDVPHLDATIHAASHAAYFPGASPITIKLTFAPDNGTLLGAQLVGYDGVDKRIDLISSLLQAGKTVHELADFEHAYAPPYSSAKDPINIAGMVAQNILDGTTRFVSWHDVVNDQAKGFFLLDVRTRDEFQLGSIEGAMNIPLDELREHLEALPREATIVAFCGVGLRSHVACRILAQHGFSNVYNLSGGYKTFKVATQKQSNENIFENQLIGNNDAIYTATKMDKTKTPASFAEPLMRIDACGLQCPGPILKLKTAIDDLEVGDVLHITASDAGFYPDVQAWTKVTGHELLSLTQENGQIKASIRKGEAQAAQAQRQGGRDATLICFSDNLDKALATFVIANGAASMGKKVTIFFTFWGLNVIKRRKKPAVSKDLFGKLFGWMMASSSQKLGLSKMNMGGLGGSMMRMVMKKRNVDSLETMMQTALDNGVAFVACQMSMDVMGVKAEEFIDGVQLGGVATYLERSESANLTLFL